MHYVKTKNTTKFKSKVVNIFMDSDGLKSKVMENIIGLKRYGAQIEMHSKTCSWIIFQDKYH